MASKVYWLKFGTGDARTNTGLLPTFLQFYDSTGQTLSPPSITEVKYGGVTNSGAYGFSYTIGLSTSNSIYFLAFAATTLTTASDSYVSGVLDPVLAVDQQLTAVGNTAIAIGTSGQALGTTAVAYLSALSSSQLAIGATILAIGNTLPSIMAFNSSFIGSTASSFGTTGVDPSTVFGYLKRIQELMEGDQVFYPAGGTFLLYNRASSGTTTLLRVKDIVNSGASVNKTGQ